MSDIKITFKDGSVKEFKHEGRAGGSWTKSLQYKESFVVVTDEWLNETAFPSADIAKVEVTPSRGAW